MKRVIGFFVCFLLCPLVMAQGFGPIDAVGPRLTVHFEDRLDVAEDYFRESLLDGLLDDHHVRLKGMWTDEQKRSLRQAVRLALPSRSSRFAVPEDATLEYEVSFGRSDVFSVRETVVYYLNEGVQVFDGAAGLHRMNFTIPETATTEEIAMYLEGRLPQRLMNAEAAVALVADSGRRLSPLAMCQSLLQWLR